VSTHPGIGTVNAVIVDCVDPGMLAAFWAELLGLSVSDRNGNDWVDLRPMVAGDPILAFQQVPELKHVKNRLHLDVRVDDLRAAVDRVRSLGGSTAGNVHRGEHPWRVMRDSEGNEFCLVTI
jgi:predicted enzyme related to lactoylglutathione lyase